MSRLKILFVISNIDYSLGFDWVSFRLDPNKFEQVYLFLNPVPPTLDKIFKERGIETYYLPYHSKKDLPIASFRIWNLIRKLKPAVVHAHLFDACLAALPAAWATGVPKRIYTRHHSTFHHVYHPSAVKYDKLINSLCTDIVAISANVAEVLKDLEKVPEKKIKLVYHGFDLDIFEQPDAEHVTQLRNKLSLNGKGPVIGVISRYTHWKGIQYIIPAFQWLLKKYPDAKLVLANAVGDYQNEIKTMLQTLPPESYVELEFERDVAALYSLFHIFVHVPVDPAAEAFGQTYVEALAAGIPAVFTLSGIAREFIEHGRNAWVVPFENSEAIYNALCGLLDNELGRKELSEKGREDVRKLFTIDKMISALEELYGS
jgi:glycosyltransferase involved in cell wall biosynthesis